MPVTLAAWEAEAGGLRRCRHPLKRMFKTGSGSLCNPGSPRTHCVDQTGLKLTQMHLLHFPECWAQSCVARLASYESSLKVGIHR